MTTPQQQPEEPIGANLDQTGEEFIEHISKLPVQEQWTEEFDRKFPYPFFYLKNVHDEWEPDRERVKSFIKSQLEAARREEWEKETKKLNAFAYEVRDALKRNRTGKIRAAVWDILKKYSALIPPHQP